MGAAIFISLLSLVLSCLGQGTLHITFEGQPPGTAYTVTNYIESGMSFSAIPPSYGFGRVGADVGSGFPRSGLPDNGSAYLKAALTDTLMFGFVDGSAFSPISVDLAEYSTVVPNAVTVPFVGYRQDGSVVNTAFTTDGIIDGTGPLADFETFYFGPEFSNLTRVEIPAWGWSLDNLYLTVPEPSVLALLCLAGAVLAIRAVRNRGSPAG